MKVKSKVDSKTLALLGNWQVNFLSPNGGGWGLGFKRIDNWKCLSGQIINLN